MKIIDLLNKIANGEIDRNNKYHFSNYDYCTIDEFFNRYILDEENLNSEILEFKEEKKIPEKLDIRQEKNIKNNWKWKVYGEEHSYNISTPQKIIADKLNQVIDYLKNKGDE